LRPEAPAQGGAADPAYPTRPSCPASPDEGREGEEGRVGKVCEVHLLEYLPERIVIQAEMTAPGYVILADRFDDGWRAYVDDAEVPIARANGVERLVAVPAGSHVVRFSYAPFPVYVGVGISAVAGLAWLGMLVTALVSAVRLRRVAGG
jgi:hypothetical protein